jgi:hypothetical protein
MPERPPWHRPFAEQVAFFRQKLNLPTERWDDISKEEHDRAFIVAGAQGADLLADLNAAVSKAISDGTGLDAFRKDFKALVARHGWSGWTGEGSKEGVAWRTKVIYQTNMSTSYAAGRWQQLNDPELGSILPYWRYTHSDSVLYPRPLHVSWDGLTLPRDHQFWRTHFPPNGWGCHCRVIPASKSDYMKAIAGGKGPADAPAPGNVDGIDRGFAYAPGASIEHELRTLINDKVAKLPAPIAEAFTADAAKALPGSPFAGVQFAEAKTAREAGAWAVRNNLVNHADYTGIKPEVANAINESLLAHLQEFPELRASQKFIGTAQAQMARHRQNEIERYLAALIQHNPSTIPEHVLRAIAEDRVKLHKIDNRYAQAWDQVDVAGIGVNKKWGADPQAFKMSLARGVGEGWHPVGTYTIRSVADHEFGHMLDYALDLRLDQEVIATYKEARAAGVEKEVSGYAAKNIQEFIAECWAESINNPSPRPFAARIASLVRSRYRARFAG